VSIKIKDVCCVTSKVDIRERENRHKRLAVM